MAHCYELLRQILNEIWCLMMENDQFYLIFRCAVASLYEVVSYRPSVGPSVRMSRVIFEGEKNAY